MDPLREGVRRREAKGGEEEGCGAMERTVNSAIIMPVAAQRAKSPRVSSRRLASPRFGRARRRAIGRANACDNAQGAPKTICLQQMNSQVNTVSQPLHALLRQPT